ncbi:MAG: potassium/proton antiporter [Tissierellia bacterium]|nr:potassium/proton antiporter [Tissierellia bacterium]
MNEPLLLLGAIIFISILINRFLERLPIPSLLIFIGLGMVFGENGIFKIDFDNYLAVSVICSICLIFIMFYGGFGTNIRVARPVLLPAVTMSTLGVVGTAGGVFLVAHYILSLPWLESFLIGSVISSTDAASVFNILRSKKLSLKYHTDSLLEVESGSNDPMSFMLTNLAISLMSGASIKVPLILIEQIGIGVISGLALGWIALKLLQLQLLPTQESHTIFLLAIMVLAYAIPSSLNGNGYLSVYLAGMWIGNAKLPQKKYLIHFFDVLTHVAQVQIFFLLGLLVTPVDLPEVLLPAIVLMVFLTLLVRPLVTSILLAPFRPKKEQVGVTAWAGLRGAASIVFAIGAMLSDIDITYNLYNLVFCIVIMSISIQGSFLPWIAKKLSMIDKTTDINHTFNDYQEDSDISFIKIHLEEKNSWCNKTLAELHLPAELLVSLVIRGDEIIVPTGQTLLQGKDMIVLAARSFDDQENFVLSEVVVENQKQYCNKTLSQIPQMHSTRIILVKRGMNTIIPSGKTVIKPGDILILSKFSSEMHVKKQDILEKTPAK